MADETKRERRPPKRLIDDYPAVSLKKRKTKPAKDNHLYEVEVVEVDKSKNRVKIHYKGFGVETDEWRDLNENAFPLVRLEKAPNPEGSSLVDRMNSFHSQVYREVKHRLWSVRIEVNVDFDVFSAGLAMTGKRAQVRAREVYSVAQNHDLDAILGLKWNKRIFNENGDFAYVVNGTVKYWMT